MRTLLVMGWCVTGAAGNARDELPLTGSNAFEKALTHKSQ